MQLVSEEYRRLNAEMHETIPDYGVQGKEWIPTLNDLVKVFNTTDVLDYGCGKGTLSMHLPFTIQQYDPAIPRWSDLPRPADIVMCTDVLEHIEPELIGNVLDHLRDLTKVVLFTTICTELAKKKLPDGRNAHLIVEPPRWWFSAMEDRFEIVNYTRMVNHAMITAIPRKRA